MSHLAEEQMLDAYYGDLPEDLRGHLDTCASCREAFEQLKATLDSVREYPVPERGEGYGGEVWTRLLPNLPQPKPKRRFGWLNAWVLGPAMAALLTLAFLGGKLSERNEREHGMELSEKARERVLLISLSDHLERSQIVLAELENAEPGTNDISRERDRAHELLGANRLLRQTALRLGDLKDASLLDDLERVLLDVANGPDINSPEDTARLQQTIVQKGLLFKVRVTSADSRERGLKL